MSRRHHGFRVSAAAVLGRARADRWPLLLTVTVLVLATALAAVVPRLVARTGDEAVRHAVVTAGDDARVTLTRPLAVDPSQTRTLDPQLAAATADVARTAEVFVPDLLADVLTDPVAAVVTSALGPVEPHADVVRPTVRLAYLWREEPPVVEWVAGGPAGSTVTAAEAAELVDGGVWPLEVGLAEDVADALGLAVGDRWPLENANETVRVDLVVSGVFRAADPADPAWSSAPGLLEPRAVGTNLSQRTEITGLLSSDSLPVAVLATPAGATARTVTFEPDVDALVAEHGVDGAAELAAEVAGMKVASREQAFGSGSLVQSGLDDVLLDVRAGVGAATAQTAVVLAGLLAGAAGALVLTARLLARRRAPALTTYRARGATVLGLAVELGVEAVLVTVVGCGAGLLLAGAVAPGAVPLGWVVPVVVATLVALPALGVREAVRGTVRRRTPADHHERRTLERDRSAGRLAVELAVVVASAGAVAALRARGATSAGTGVDPLLALAPTLAAVAGALLLLRLLPLLLRVALRRATRSRHAVPVLAAARAHATAREPLALLVVAVVVALAGFGGVVAATVQEGEVEASWAEVGADVAVVTEPDPELTATAAALLAGDGVTHAVPARVDEHAQVFGEWGGRLVRVVAVAADGYEELVTATPLPDAPGPAELDRLRAGAPGEPVPALVTADLLPSDDEPLSLLWGDARVPVQVVGTATGPLTESEVREDTVVVDLAAVGAAAGEDVAPDRLWVAGPDAEAAVAGLPGLGGAEVTARASWLADHRSQPLTAAVPDVARAAAVGLLLLAVLAVVLGAATSARGRGRTLATLRTLGVDGAAARRVGLGELLPGALLAAVGGAVVGAGLAVLVTEPLELHLVTGQTLEPRVVVPWAATLTVPPLVVAGAVGVVVLVESSVRRRERLGEVLRVGGA